MNPVRDAVEAACARTARVAADEMGRGQWTLSFIARISPLLGAIMLAESAAMMAVFFYEDARGWDVAGPGTTAYIPFFAWSVFLSGFAMIGERVLAAVRYRVELQMANVTDLLLRAVDASAQRM